MLCARFPMSSDSRRWPSGNCPHVETMNHGAHCAHMYQFYTYLSCHPRKCARRESVQVKVLWTFLPPSWPCKKRLRTERGIIRRLHDTKGQSQCWHSCKSRFTRLILRNDHAEPPFPPNHPIHPPLFAPPPWLAGPTGTFTFVPARSFSSSFSLAPRRSKAGAGAGPAPRPSSAP
jgi:hypothetical protein